MFVSYSEFTVVFKYEIDPSTFAADDINLTDANGNSISIVSIQAIDNKTFQITLPAGLAEGQYNLSIGPDIQGIDGSRMDQNDDAVDDGDLDAYTLSFEVDLTPFKIRVAADYTSAMCPDVSVACCESDRSWCNNVQAAVDIAEEGDLVLIEPGEYIDSIHINKYVHLKGNSLDPSDVVLQGDESQVGGTTNVVGISGFDDAIRSPMVIEGLTVRPYQGGSSSSSFAFDHNLFNDTVLINRVRSEIASASNQNHLLNLHTSESCACEIRLRFSAG